MSEPVQLDILVFGAHADDAEIGMGGTIVKQVQAGYKVGICDLTLAEMSSNGTVETRKKEAAEASRRLGLSVRTNLQLPDRGLSVCPEQIEAIVLEIRKYRPRIVFAPYWQDRHPDHVMCSHLVQEAVFNSKLRKYRPDIASSPVDQLLFYFINDVDKPNLLVDITDYHSAKLHALQAFRSQFAWDSPQSVQTVLNSGYLEMVSARDRMMGQQRFMTYAEGFVSKQPYVVRLF